MKEEFRTKGGIYWVGDKEARGRDSGISCVKLGIVLPLKMNRILQCLSEKLSKCTAGLTVNRKSKRHNFLDVQGSH